VWLCDRVWLSVCLLLVQHELCLFLVSLSIIMTEERIMVVARHVTDNARE
jgi:hypothetical protein